MYTRGMRWARNVARMGDMRRAHRVLVGRPEKYNFADLCVHGRIILKCIFRDWDGEAWTGLLWVRIGTGCGLLLMR